MADETEKVDDEKLDETQETEVVENAGQEEQLQEAEQQTEQRTWRHELGDEFANVDDATAVATLKQRLAAQSQMQQAAAQWQKLYTDTNSQWQSWQQQLQQSQAQQQQQQQKPAWQVPDFDPRWVDMVQRDENNNLVPKPGAMPDLPAKIQAYVQWKAEQEQKFYKNPGEFVLPLVAQPIQEWVGRAVQQAITQERVTNAVTQWEKSHLDILTSDKQMIRPDGGNLSQLGRQVIQEAKMLQASGVANPHAALEMAYDRLYGAAAAAEYQRLVAAKSQPVKTQEQQQEGTLRRVAAQKPSRNGKVNGAEKIEHMSVGDRLRKNFVAAGFNSDEDEHTA